MMLFRYLHWRSRTRRGRIPWSFSASMAAGYARFLSTFTTRGVGVLLRSKHFVEEAFGSFGVAFCREQKIDGLAG
jgi:hypothetical protein